MAAAAKTGAPDIKTEHQTCEQTPFREIVVAGSVAEGERKMALARPQDFGLYLSRSFLNWMPAPQAEALR